VNITIGLFIVALTIFIAVYAVLVVAFRPRVDIDKRVRLPRASAAERRSWREMLRSLETLFKPLGEIIPRSPEEMSKYEKLLVQAGYRRKDAVILFYGSQVAVALVVLGITAITGYLYTNLIVSLAISIFCGIFLPNMWLNHSVGARRERITLALPDALDLAVVCVEAGLGLDQALMRIAEELRGSHPELSEEFRLRNIEINMGRSRADAFRNLSVRTGSDDVKALTAILIQTDRFGTSVGTALRVFAESLRLKRRQRARERAAKLPVKMIPVMVLFIFPSVFVVIVGPAVIQIIRMLLPLLA